MTDGTSEAELRGAADSRASVGLPFFTSAECDDIFTDAHKKSSFPFIFQIFQTWLLKEFSMGYSTLTSSPGRRPVWPEEAEAGFRVAVKEIDTYQMNLSSMTQQLELVVKFTAQA